MGLVGKPIIIARSHIPDVCSTLPAPSATVVSVGASGVTLPAGNYAVVVTQRNAYGETLPSAETTGVVVDGSHGIQVTSALLPGATAIRAYLTLAGGASGSEIQWVESTTTPFTISSPPTGAGVPPVNSSAYMPDSDGNTFSAATMFAWLSEGLKIISREVGGILDYCGVPTLAGQPLYVLPGQWVQITDVWYGGYWIQGGKRGDFFRLNAVTSRVLNNVTISIFSDKQVMEVSYQPDRSAGVTTTTESLSATATSVPIASSSVFLLPFGFAQIGSEVVAYSNLAGSTMAGLIRGIGNTVAQAWPSGTTVTELSLFWCGKRIFNTEYQPGQSGLTLAVPDGWDVALALYLQAKAKMSEQDMQAADALMKQSFQMAKETMESNIKPPSFMQAGGTMGPATYGQTIAGGLIQRF